VTAEQERRGNRVAGTFAVLSVAASFAALLVLLGTTSGQHAGREALGSLLDADAHRDALLAATGLRVAGLLALVGVGVRLVDLVRTRDAAPPAVRVLAIVAPLAVAAAAVASHVALLDAASTLVDGGARTQPRADHLLHDGGLQRASAVATVLAAVAFAGWLAWLSMLAARVGLLTRTLGWWGVGAGLASVLVPVAGQGLVLGWVGSVALLLLGWWPGGRGPSWTSGTSEPWDPRTESRPRSTVVGEEKHSP
jgi:hypothetical protein